MKRLLVIITAAVMCLAAPQTASAQDTVLSNELTITRWAYPVETTKVRTQPRRSARAITRLRYLTEDGLPEIYVVLKSREVAGRTWMLVRLPMRPNGKTGWVPEDSLSELHINRTRLVIDRGSLRAKFYVSGRLKWSSVVGVGAAGTPTPRGNFYIRERMTGFGGSYGPVAFGTSAYSSLSEWPNGGVIGIHGTDRPDLLPGRVSHGCVRVPNSKIRQLDRLMKVGTPVKII